MGADDYLHTLTPDEKRRVREWRKEKRTGEKAARQEAGPLSGRGAIRVNKRCVQINAVHSPCFSVGGLRLCKQGGRHHVRRRTHDVASGGRFFVKVFFANSPTIAPNAPTKSKAVR